MSKHWLKVEKDTPDKPEIRTAARLCKVTREVAFHAFFKLWSFFDTHSVNGSLPGLALDDLDEAAGLAGFGRAMEQVGWLKVEPAGVTVANWERHNGKSAKARAQTMYRVQVHRAQKRWDPARVTKV